MQNDRYQNQKGKRCKTFGISRVTLWRDVQRRERRKGGHGLSKCVLVISRRLRWPPQEKAIIAVPDWFIPRHRADAPRSSLASNSGKWAQPSGARCAPLQGAQKGDQSGFLLPGQANVEARIVELHHVRKRGHGAIVEVGHPPG